MAAHHVYRVENFLPTPCDILYLHFSLPGRMPACRLIMTTVGPVPATFHGILRDNTERPLALLGGLAHLSNVRDVEGMALG